MRNQLLNNTSTRCIDLVSECYANKCVANKLSEILRRRKGYIVRVVHSYVHGRDRIVSKILKRVSMEQQLIAIIDYERGVSRAYIDKHFELKEIESRILIGTSKRKSNVMVIVFGPDIEDALLCRISKDLCRDLFKLKRIKSRDACSIVEKLIEESEEGKRILYRLSEEILSKLST